MSVTGAHSERNRCPTQTKYSVAEGVETQEQRDALSADDCDYYQGYLFSMPLPRDEALAVARNR